MAGALIGALRVTLGLDATYFEEGTKGASRAAKKLEKDLASAGKSISGVGRSMTLGITAPVAAFGVTAVKAAMESSDALAQVENTIKTMGNAAGRSSEQLSKLATGLMENSLYDDDEILRKLTTTMLTFGKVTGETFDRAQQAALDLSAKFGKDLQGSAIMLGKALNDPVKGVSALTKVGISFTAQQKEQIKAMAAVGNVAGAQKLILTELEKQVAGAAKTAADANPFTALKHAWDDFQEEVGGQLLKILPPFTDALKTMVSAFASMSPEMQKVVVIGALLAAALGPVLMAIGSLLTIASTAAPAFLAFGASVSAAATAAGVGGTVMGTLGAGLGVLLSTLLPVVAALAAVYLAWKNWDTIAPILDGLWDSISASIGPPLLDIITTLSSALSTLWSGPLGSAIKSVVGLLAELGAAFLVAAGPEIINLFKGLAALLGDALGIIGGVLKVVVGILTDDWSMAWEGAKGVVSSVVSAILNVLDLLFPGARKAILGMVEGIKQWLTGPFTAAFDSAKAKVRELTDAFAWMYDKVVGHSYVPDMVDGISRHMDRLDGEMAGKAKKAISKTTEAFRKMQEEVKALLSDLFPDAAELSEYRRKMDLIARAEKAGPKGGGLTPEEADAARRRAAGLDQESDQGAPTAVQEMIDSLGEIKPDLDKVQEGIDGFTKDAEDKTARTAVAFAEMAQNVIGSLRGMVSSFKSGDILGGIQGILDLVGQVLNVIGMIKGAKLPGASGGGFSSRPGFSTGGNFKVGGSGGVDSKLVQFRATPGEMVNIRRPGAMNDNGQTIVVRVVKGEMFDAHVERVARPLAAQAAIQGAAGGSAHAQRQLAAQRRSTLP